MARHDYRAAEAICQRALSRAQGDQNLIEGLKRATLLKQCDDFLSQLDREVQKKGDIRIDTQQLITP